ncbi:MAG TPA: DUF5665 domain-containing protein [Patescibacteria group bacterium]|nr:DUF5665 domain-containing protein [Patescibacteria group bacterium]
MSEPKDKIYRPKSQIFVDNLIGGVAWAIGATFGVTIILALLGFVLKSFNWVPFVGGFIVEINKYLVLHR